jgi:release factor glutamine methyltransferase
MEEHEILSVGSSPVIPAAARLPCIDVGVLFTGPDLAFARRRRADSSAAMRIVTLPGVFRPISDTWLLAGALRERAPGARVLDVCTGSGALAVTAALAGASAVTAVDVSRRAVLTARMNARLNGATIDARRSNLFDALHDQRFDVIVANPPYVPDPSGDELPTRGARRAWDAGHDGRLILDRLIAEAPSHLRPGGTLLLVQSEICGTDETLERMWAAGLVADVVIEHHGPLGPLMAERVAHLRERGALGADQTEERVVVIAGVLPASGAVSPADAPRAQEVRGDWGALAARKSTTLCMPSQNGF